MTTSIADLTDLKTSIEQFDRADQARALKIILDNDVAYDENANGVFVNMANIPADVLVKLAKYAGYVHLQQNLLEDQEAEKETLLQNYFKGQPEEGAC
jgi:predicted metallo-beta-lactamase superfamily hydrolase